MIEESAVWNLVLDDEPFMPSLLVPMLKRQGFERVTGLSQGAAPGLMDRSDPAPAPIGCIAQLKARVWQVHLAAGVP